MSSNTPDCNVRVFQDPQGPWQLVVPSEFTDKLFQPKCSRHASPVHYNKEKENLILNTSVHLKKWMLQWDRNLETSKWSISSGVSVLWTIIILYETQCLNAVLFLFHWNLAWSTESFTPNISFTVIIKVLFITP